MLKVDELPGSGVESEPLVEALPAEAEAATVADVEA
jgi:hypothetical protein